MNKTHIISVRITDRTYDFLAKKAKKNKIPMSSIVNKIIENVIDSEKKINV